MSDKQLAILIDNMAKALSARLQALEAEHPELKRERPADALEKWGAGVRGEDVPETVKVQSPELAALWQLVKDWQDDAGSLRGDE